MGERTRRRVYRSETYSTNDVYMYMYTRMRLVSRRVTVQVAHLIRCMNGVAWGPMWCPASCEHSAVAVLRDSNFVRLAAAMGMSPG